ncbi:hypothetical protein [Flavobacterium sp. GP15]|uniref:hypothetical protein n=1 Tax=Flavobacterium sp. GP15 TaxID=2758567 RepID=UPI00165EA882|nr:hypothetical protein [Flavobacterium sp. GP15]
MNKQLILTSLIDAVDKIVFHVKTYRAKARNLTQIIFRLFLNDDTCLDFSKPKQIPNAYFKKIIKGAGALSTVLRELKNAEILLTDGKYSTGKGKGKAFCKSYILNPTLIYHADRTFTQFENINKINDRVKFKKIKKTLESIEIDSAVYDFIPKLIESELSEILIGDKIDDVMITFKIKGEQIRNHINYWLANATRNNIALIKFKGKFYLESASTFRERKRVELEISYTYSIENIKNGHFYANRNNTNNRLDHNLTALKRELFQFIILDGEKTVEVDIANAQFALLSNISSLNLDSNFIDYAQNGKLYESIGREIGKSKKEVKAFTMVALFGKTRNHPKQLRKLFPKTMKSIAEYKNKNGYKSFSVMLQQAESNLMIDGVYNLLTKNNIPTIPVHDSMRVKESDYIRTNRMMVDFFNEKNFKCELKPKE